MSQSAEELPPSIVDPSVPLTARLKPRSRRASLQRWMQNTGIRERGPANFPLVAEALSRGIEVSANSRGSTLLSCGGVSFTWRSGKTSLNHASANKLVRHKEIQSRVFRSAGLAFPENCAFSKDEKSRAWSWASHILPVVVKPADGSLGQDVVVNITEESQFYIAFDEVAQKWGEVLVEEFKQGTEHRLFVVDGKFTAALVMRPANVTGDGVSTVEDLVRIKNKTAFIPHREIRLEAQELGYLDALHLTSSSVIDEGQTIYLRRNSNLSTGGDSVDATDHVRLNEARLAEAAAKAWPGMRSVGFDLLLPRKEGDGVPTIIEANMGSGIGGHHYPRFGRPREVCVPILNAMFPQTARQYPTPPKRVAAKSGR